MRGRGDGFGLERVEVLRLDRALRKILRERIAQVEHRRVAPEFGHEVDRSAILLLVAHRENRLQQIGESVEVVQHCGMGDTAVSSH